MGEISPKPIVVYVVKEKYTQSISEPSKLPVRLQQAFVMDHYDDDDHQCIDQRDCQHGESPVVSGEKSRLLQRVNHRRVDEAKDSRIANDGDSFS